MSNHWQKVSWDSALSLCTFWSVSIISTCLIPSWQRHSMAVLCWRRTSIFDITKSDVITMVTAHFKNPFCVLESISDGMFLWNFNELWRHLCVLFNFIHYLLIDPCNSKINAIRVGALKESLNLCIIPWPSTHPTLHFRTSIMCAKCNKTYGIAIIHRLDHLRSGYDHTEV